MRTKKRSRPECYRLFNERLRLAERRGKIESMHLAKRENMKSAASIQR